MVQLARFDGAEARQHGEVVAGAGAELEDARILGRPDDPLDDAVEDPPPGGEPPVTAVELGHLLIDLALHQTSPMRSRTT